ncbi:MULTISPECIES: response regulator [Niastella]|uniref:Response regulator n=1 Tax=Niastella soli TaxID=2821487 RepID=A0ABS3Z4R7_9BACT|nr:response regulator [Niastella soli]MBO9205141.1 response regulator [Niastella soli]
MTQPRSFLLVDDDIDDIIIFQETLKKVDDKIGFFYVNNGKDAFDLLIENNPNLPSLIFLDINMPRMDGKECLKLLKQDSRLKHIPVLMYTTSSQSADIEDTMMHGALAFITKPWGVNELKKLLSAIAHSPISKLPQTLQSLEKEISCFIVC